MTQKEFNDEIEVLENYYDKEYTTEQRGIMFQELKEINIVRFKKIISAVIRKNKFLPKLADFLDVTSEIPYQNFNTPKKVKCDICFGSGYVFYKKIISNENMEYNCACRCICLNGQSKNKEIPTFQELGIMPGEKVVVEEVNE